MASSASYIHKPEAPVAPFDLNIMSKVLLYKQSKFDAGVDMVQSRINQLESQQVLGDAQKQYVSEKINSMVNNINGMGGMDFSDRNVINKTSSYIDSIAKDPIVTNAITNTRNIQKGMAYFEKLRSDAASGKKGVYYNPANEYDYMEGVNDYLRRSKTDASAAYNDRPIAPPVDVNKALMDTAKNVVASTYTTRDGQNRYILKTGEVVTPERLYQTALTQIQTDPNLANQIRINSKYNYLQRDANGSISAQQLAGIRDTYLQSNQNKISSLQNEIVEQAKLKASTSDMDAQTKIQSNIDNLSAELTSYVRDQEGRERSIDALLATNPEAAAQNVYTNKLLEGIVAAKAYRQENVKFDQAAMFVDKMNLEQAKFEFDKEQANNKFALEQVELALKAQELQIKADKEQAGLTNAAGGLYSEEVSPPTNTKLSGQDVIIGEVRGVDMQKANVQQDYYYYLYNFKNGQGLVQKDGNKYIPTERGKSIWADNMKSFDDMRKGKVLPAPLDPEFIKQAIKYQDLELVKQQYLDNMTAVNRQALDKKRKDLGMSEADYDLFLKGKSIVDQLPDNNASVSTIGIRAKDYSKLPQDPESKKAYQMYFKYNKSLIPDKEEINRIYEAQMTQLQPRTYVPAGLKQADLDARQKSLSGMIYNRGYFTLNGEGKPESTARTKDIPYDKITYMGDFYGNLGDGFKPYVKAQITTGEGDKKQTETIFVDVDDTYTSNFRNFALNPNEAAKQQVLRTNKVSFNSASQDGRNLIQTEVIKEKNGSRDESALVQVYVTHDKDGKLITPQPVIIKGTRGMNISQAVEYARKFAEDYSQFYKQSLKSGLRPRTRDFVDILNK